MFTFTLSILINNPFTAFQEGLELENQVEKRLFDRSLGLGTSNESITHKQGKAVLAKLHVHDLTQISKCILIIKLQMKFSRISINKHSHQSLGSEASQPKNLGPRGACNSAMFWWIIELSVRGHGFWPIQPYSDYGYYSCLTHIDRGFCRTILF